MTALSPPPPCTRHLYHHRPPFFTRHRCFAEEGKHLSDKDLRDIILNFIIAGRDTTAQALSWTIFRLCTVPDVQKVRLLLLQFSATATACYNCYCLL